MVGARKIIWALSLMARYVPRKFYSSIPGWPQTTVDDHGELLDGMRGKDVEKTRAAMIAHIIHSGELLAANFDERVNAADRATA